jgi:hypothetical protein
MKYFTLALLFGTILSLKAQVAKVEIVRNANGSFELLRNGQPYYIQGAGGTSKLEELKAYGGNSIRTWGISEDTDKILDQAHKLGITVCFGIWMGQERQGFDYTNEAAVKGQLEEFRRIVKKYKNHPAILVWGVGNEMDLDYSNFDVWKHLEEICKMVKEEDPNHPTMAVTAGLDVAEVKLIKKHTPSLDILGVNTYGDIAYLPEAVEKYGWEKPYIVAEWGPYGYWEVEKTVWGAAIEETSTQKAQTYSKSLQAINSDKKNCLGSYVFLWGNKQEHTATWFNLFLESGEQTAVMDVLIRGWSKMEPKNRAPNIQSFVLQNQSAKQSIVLLAGQETQAQTETSDADNDDLTYIWQIVPESTDKKSGGDAEIAPKPLKGIFRKASKKQSNVRFMAPKKQGQYRLFLYVFDGKNNVATANIPFIVKDNN